MKGYELPRHRSEIAKYEHLEFMAGFSNFQISSTWIQAIFDRDSLTTPVFWMGDFMQCQHSSPRTCSLIRRFTTIQSHECRSLPRVPPFLSSRIFGPLMSRWKASEFLVQPIGQVWSVPSSFSRDFLVTKKSGRKGWWNRCPEPDDWGFLNFENFIAVWGSYSQHTPGNKINIYIYIIIYLYIQVFLLKNA